MTATNTQAGGEAAVRHIKLVRQIVKRRFYGLTKLGYDVDDLVQEGLYAIIRGGGCYKPSRGVSESTYYGKLAFNWIKSRVYKSNLVQKRAARLRNVSLDAPISSENQNDTLYAYIPSGADTEQVAINNVLLRSLLSRLKRDHPDQFVAVVMRYFGDYYGSEIGQHLGCSEAWANYLVVNGVKSMRRYMKIREAYR